MNLKEMIFGGNVRPGGDSGAYRDSIQVWIPKKISWAVSLSRRTTAL